ncbi:hypothetical protein D3Z51_03900 [Clostridiaceae bacterium]|nr:hypothetical protein [Clostridiaceae bacterium]RKI13348.1 hypothetical protein D7V81_10375 [bacterium 1XD21-70]
MKRCLNCMEEYQEKEEACPYCKGQGFSAPADAMEEGGIVDGRYIVGTFRCRGDNGFWYIGWDALFRRRVLVMEYFPQGMVCRAADGTVKVQDAKEKDYAECLGRFVDGSRKLISLDDTPGLLNVLAVTEDRGSAYAILEYPEGTSLNQLLQKQDVCPPEQVQWLVQELSVPLAAAHRLGVCHGQICGERIFVAPDGSCRIGGFGGSPPGEDRQAGVEKDIRALANLAGSMLTGRQRWEGKTFEENLRFLGQSVPECITDALRAALGGDRDRRPGSIRRFADLFLDEATIEMYPDQETRIGREQR